MYFSFRTTQLKDIGQCLPLIQDPCFSTPENHKHLLAFWNYVLSEDVALSSVVVDHGRTPHKIVGFEMSLFVRDEYLLEANSLLPQTMALQAVNRWRKGRRVFLSSEEIARKNSQSGLNVLNLHYNWARQGLNTEQSLNVRLKLSESFLGNLKGYQIKEILREVHGLEEKLSMVKSGFVLRRNYQIQNPAAPLNESSSPFFLLGINREEGRQCDQNHSIAQLFCCPAGRFHFSPRQKEVLQQALQGRSDSDIALYLDLSLWTVKKRWQAIYEKVQAVDPELLNPEEKTRGLEKEALQRRPHLMDYLWHHPEEIRPSATNQRDSSTGKTADSPAIAETEQAVG